MVNFDFLFPIFSENTLENSAGIHYNHEMSTRDGSRRAWQWPWPHKIVPIPLCRFRRNREFLEVQSKEPHWSSTGRKWIKKKKKKKKQKTRKEKKREGKSENGDPLAAPTTGNSSCPSSSISSSFSFLCPAKT